MNLVTCPLIMTEDGYDPSANKNANVFKSGIIGQSEACKKLAFFVDSHSSETPFPTMLFSGSQGLGKTYMAQKVADALGRELVEINCGNIDTVKQLFDEVIIKKIHSSKPKTILFDEAHKLSTEITTVLLTMLNPNKLLKNEIDYNDSKNVFTFRYVFEFAKINVIFATTDAYKMFKPLVNRCTEVYFHLYSNSDLIRMLRYYLPKVIFKCDVEDVADACRGRARDTFCLSQNIQRYCNLNKTTIIDDKAWKELKDIFGIHAKGLTTQEIEYLKVLEAHAPASSHSLAVKMGVNVQNIESEIEVRLKELNMVDNSSRGRLLTVEGQAYLDQIEGRVSKKVHYIEEMPF